MATREKHAVSTPPAPNGTSPAAASHSPAASAAVKPSSVEVRAGCHATLHGIVERPELDGEEVAVLSSSVLPGGEHWLVAPCNGSESLHVCTDRLRACESSLHERLGVAVDPQTHAWLLEHILSMLPEVAARHGERGAAALQQTPTTTLGRLARVDRALYAAAVPALARYTLTSLARRMPPLAESVEISAPRSSHVLPLLATCIEAMAARAVEDGGWLHALLCAGPVLHLAQDRSDKSCAYRSAQMLISYVMAQQRWQQRRWPSAREIFLDAPSARHVSRAVPSVRRLQRTLREAWRAGWDTDGAQQLGNSTMHMQEPFGKEPRDETGQLVCEPLPLPPPRPPPRLPTVTAINVPPAASAAEAAAPRAAAPSMPASVAAAASSASPTSRTAAATAPASAPASAPATAPWNPLRDIGSGFQALALAGGSTLPGGIHPMGRSPASSPLDVLEYAGGPIVQPHLKLMGASDMWAVLRWAGCRAELHDLIDGPEGEATASELLFRWVWSHFDAHCEGERGAAGGGGGIAGLPEFGCDGGGEGADLHGDGMAPSSLRGGGLHRCQCPPLYLQWAGHAVVIVGACYRKLHRLGKPERHLLIFNPIRATEQLLSALTNPNGRTDPNQLWWQYVSWDARRTGPRVTRDKVNSQESLESETGPGGEAGPYQILRLLPGWAHTSVDRELVRSPEDACTQHIGSAPPAKCRPNGPG